MADEIVGLEKSEQGKIRVCFYYPINTPASVAGSKPVVTPSSGLPPIAVDAWGNAKKQDLDAGDAAFEVVTVTIPEGMTTSELATRVQEMYAAKKPERLFEYRSRYRFAGATVDAPGGS